VVCPAVGSLHYMGDKNISEITATHDDVVSHMPMSRSGVTNMVPAGARSPARTAWVDRGFVPTIART